MRRWMAFLLALSALVVPLTPVATGQGQDGRPYTSPTYGYTVRWDPAVWQEVPDEALVADGPDALDRLRLEHPAGSLYVEGSRRYGGSATECSARELALFTLSPEVADVEVRADLAASGPDRSIEAAEGTLALEGGESIRLAVYVDCRRLSPEATLFATAIAPADLFDQVLPPAREVIEAIGLPGDGEQEPDSALSAALREAAAGTPVAGPLDGSLPLAPGTLETLSAGVDLADFATRADFTNPYPAADHPFDIGFGFRQEGGDAHLRLVVDSDGVWYLKDGLGPTIASGRLDGLRTGAGETNTVELIARGGAGGFAVNGVFVADLDFSARTGRGDVFAGSGFFAEDARAGFATGVGGFAVWPLAGAGTPVSLDEASFADLLEAARQAPPLAGPQEGTLAQVEGAAALAQAGVEVADFAVRVRWANPETAFWDTGVAFRDQPDGRHYRLTFDQTGSWTFGVGLEPKLASGGAASMRLGPGVVNTLELVVAGEQAAFSVNGVFVALLDTSAISEPGDVWFGSGFSAGAVTAGTAVRYRDLTVWALPSAGSPSRGAEAGTAAQATPTVGISLPTATPEIPPTTEPTPTVEPPPTVEPTPTAAATPAITSPPTVEPMPTVEPVSAIDASPTVVPVPTSAPLPGPPLLPAPPPVATAVPADPPGGEVGGTPEASSRRIVAVRVVAVAGSGVQGLATVTDVAGSASVQLAIEGAEGGETAAIFEGSCDGLPAEPFAALTGLERGRSRTLLDRPTGALLGGGFVLAVFAGEGTGRAVVACGEIPG